MLIALIDCILKWIQSAWIPHLCYKDATSWFLLLTLEQQIDVCHGIYMEPICADHERLRGDKRSFMTTWRIASWKQRKKFSS
jgi:hypothetical protein